MTSLSPRYALALCALLALCASPIGFHAIVAPTVDDCRNPSAFFEAERLAGAVIVPPSKAVGTLESIEGRLQGETPSPLGMRVVRTYDVSPLIASPLRFGFDPMLYVQADERRTLEAAGHAIPVHWRESLTRDESHIEAYTLVQGGRPTSHPILSGLALAWEQLIGGTRPMTVLIVAAAGRPDALPTLEREAEAWLVRAWEELDAACVAH